LIGDVLLDQKSVEPAAFERAMAVYEPDRHGRVGEYLIALGVVTAEKLAAALDMQRTASNVVLVAMVPA
jgi:adsorption protein B